MNILKYKYKAHKLINYAFYLVVFLIGFGIGFGVKKIDFNKLISQFLMIDNVSAQTFATIGNDVIDETFIFNKLSSYYSVLYPSQEFNLDIYPLIECNQYVGSYGSDKGKNNIICTAFPKEAVDNMKFIEVVSSSPNDVYKYTISPYTGGKMMFQISISEQYYGTNNYITPSNLSNGTSSLTRYLRPHYYYNYIPDTFSNYADKFNNKLEFSVNLEFNENLFKDNPDFKEVCVENNKVFAITRATNSEVNEYFDYDYIWFPYGLDGLAKGLYDSSLDDKFSYYTEQDTFGYYWFKNKENIDNYFNSDIPGLELEMKGYTNKYSYYGWSAHYFRMYFEGENTQFTIFKFVNPTTLTYNDETNTNHGGGGLRLDGDEEIQISNNYCFYVKNEYEVQYINVDEWEDYYGTVITPNGDYDFNTSHNKNNSNTDNFLSQPISFINSMKDTISFINSLIYELYISLPVLLRTFIITLLIILIIMLIMRIGGYK